MDYSKLSRDELHDMFLKMNFRYLSSLRQSTSYHLDTKQFSAVRESMRQILNELQRRRESQDITFE